jgi:hypothetical protein
MTDANRHGRETISAKGSTSASTSCPTRSGATTRHELHERDDAIISIMPYPGGGTRIAGDTPQEVLFFVTDGVEDEIVNGSRVQSLMDPSYCTTIKNRGIRIAVLYTTYLPLPIGRS